MSETEDFDERVRSALGDIAEFRDETIVIRWPISAYETLQGVVKTHSLIGRDYCSSHMLLDIRGLGHDWRQWAS
jgi:hypothetical protein